MNIRKVSYLLIGGVVVSVSGYAGLLLYLAWPLSEYSLSISGTFGDGFGLLTSLFSGLAFAGLIITILMQKDELALQREELELTRKELSGQKEEMRTQNETLKLQKFENTFFQMLSFHNEIINSMDIDRGSKAFTGRDAFQELYRRLLKTESSKIAETGNIDEVNRAYMMFFDKTHNELGHYFRNLYSMIKYIDNSEAPDKKLYTNLVRAQLSSYELVLILSLIHI